MLANLKKALGASMNKYSGNTDFLEAVCAASALVAAADGKVEDSEIDATVKAVSANPSLSGAFNGRQIEQTISQMLERANGGRVGRMGLMRELEDIAADADMCEAVMLAALDVAEGDGNIDDDEMKVLQKVADTLKQNLNSML